MSNDIKKLTQQNELLVKKIEELTQECVKYKNEIYKKDNLIKTKNEKIMTLLRCALDKYDVRALFQCDPEICEYLRIIEANRQQVNQALFDICGVYTS